jgi:hypothetical protein
MPDAHDMTDPRTAMRWVVRGAALAVLLIGWVFIGWINHFHITAPVVFACIGHLAVVATIYNLWRTGAAAAVPSNDDRDSTWAKPTGALGELEREKRTLLKAIKEAEFDHQMGKLSQRDADEMIRGYRARAIEVIKEIDRLGLGAAGTVREQILREVRARVQLESKAPKTAAVQARPSAKSTERAQQPRDAAAAKDAAANGAVTSDPVAKDAVAHEPAEAAKTAPADAAEASSAPRGAAADVRDATPGTTNAAPRTVPAAVQRPRDDELDADSTTAFDPGADDPVKEAAR